ncbi:hypothetical protein B0A50_00849 [Salinomyces thailandicus]|uniref:Uncharacterized protein n=1 Tax=Salinomyces thailandicus TaxID=706561 RepID=A0A4U0UFA0_9PEZI|nr:hypothetical protein B0A50_00849 [Salinomyces thailandica]
MTPVASMNNTCTTTEQHQHRGAGSSRVLSPISRSKPTALHGPVLSTDEPSTTKRSSPRLSKLKDESRAGAYSSPAAAPQSYARSTNRKKIISKASLRHLDTSMSSYASTVTLPSAPRSAPAHGKLHKRNHSGSSLPVPPSPLTGGHSQFITPYATYEERTDAAPTPPMSSTPKLKPCLRKMSTAKDDPLEQGKIDLSKSSFDQDRCAGLGIHDFGARSVSDVPFAHAAKRAPHTRATSVGSQVSTGSASFKPSQPFVHPMRQSPRPYTPPASSSTPSFGHEEEANERDDIIVDDDFHLNHNHRSRRSVSISSTPAIAAPTPLSQSYSASDLGMIPKLTSASQTNLSLKSSYSTKSTKSRTRGRTRRDPSTSIDLPTSPSSRTSFDKAFSLVSRKSDPDPQSRDDRIRAARQKFEEKEAHKDRKHHQEQLKRRETNDAKEEKKQERERRKSEVEEQTRISNKSTLHIDPRKAKQRRQDVVEDQKFHARSYDDTRPPNFAALPRKGAEPGMSEKATPRVTERRVRHAQSGWLRFSAWLQTRMHHCAV